MTRATRLVAPKDLGDEVRRLRARTGLSADEAAARLGVDVETIERAEGSSFGLMVRVRKHILERLTGYTIDGPYYRIRPRTH